jgi:hypothetical protein
MYAATVSSTLATPYEIRSRTDCGIGGWYTWSFIYLCKQKPYGVKSGDLGGQGICPAPPIKAFCT